MDKQERRRRLRQRRYEQSVKGKATRAAYAASDDRKRTRAAHDAGKGRENRKLLRALAYMDRPIIAIDGEGITDRTGHRYVLLQASTGETLQDPLGIQTSVALRWLRQLARDHEDALFVSYGFGYDANCILRDVPVEALSVLRRQEYVTAGPWKLWWRPGKFFGCGGDGQNVTVYDLRSFHRGTFVEAVAQVCGEVPDVIVAGKAARGRFTLADLPQIVEYNRAELAAMVTLAETIRAGLNRLGVRLNTFDGAGAIAGAFMRAHAVKEHLPEPPDDVRRLAAFGFVGGRVECVRYGHSDGVAYQYDMNAAYPWALAQLPSWQGVWVHHDGDPGPLPFTLYDVKWWNWIDPQVPAPLPYRTHTGAIAYPVQGRALTWTPEVDLLRHDCPGMVDWYVNQAWQFIPANPDVRPFAFMHDLYRIRQEWKAAGDGMHSVLKLGMNAAWGKLAQRAGWKPGRVPAYHHLPAAGYATSLVRAQVWKAATAKPDDVIAIETDAVVTRRRVRSPYLPLGDQLGQWRETRLRNLTYAASGVAFGVTDSGEVIRRTAGVPEGRLTRRAVLAAMRSGAEGIPVERDHFVGVAQCDLSGQWEQFATWSRVSDYVPVMPTGKRVPVPSPTGLRFTRGWNATFCPLVPDEMGHPYEVPWEMSGYDLAQWMQREYAATVRSDQPAPPPTL